MKSAYTISHGGHDPLPLDDDVLQTTRSSNDGVLIAKTATRGLDKEYRPAFTLHAKPTSHWVTTNDRVFASQPKVDELQQPKTRRAPAATLIHKIDTRVYNEEDVEGAAALDDHVGVYPHGLERLGFAGRQTEAKAQFGRRAAGPDAAATLANTQARVAQTLAEEEANMTRPLVIPTPVDVGIHFRTTTQEAHQFWNPDEYRGAGNNADFSTNAVTVYSMPNVGADGGAGGWKPIKSDLETNHLGQTVPSTYVPSSLEGMRISRRAKSVQEIMQEKMAVREAKLAAGLQGSNRHLRTTYRSDFVKKHPAPEIVVDETRLDNAKMALHETIRKPEANPRDTKNSAYGSQGPLARVRLSEQEELLERLREALRASGLSNLPTLSAVFKAADASRSQSLEPDELVSVLQGFGIRVSTAQLRELWPYFDRDGSGAVDLVEFLRAVKGSLSEHRLRLVHLAFDKIDVDKNGYLDTFEMARFYDAANDPQVKAGRKKEAQVVREFLSVFDGGAKDGIVTKDEFVDYYTGVSALTDSDETFEGILRASWKMNFKLFNRKKY